VELLLASSKEEATNIKEGGGYKGEVVKVAQ